VVAKDAEHRHIGTRRGNLVYLQTQITPALSARLDELADEEDVVLGEVLMRCVRAFRPENPTTHPRRRRRSGNQVRRDIGVLPSEAAEVMGAMTAANLTVSAFLRQALERHLG
jgi:tetrahydromethanopterin S-methyltransferase subunit G